MSRWSFTKKHLFMSDNVTRNSTAIKIVTVEGFPVLMRREIIIILYSWHRQTYPRTDSRLTAGTLAAAIDLNKKIGNVTGFPYLPCETGGRLQTHMNPEGMFLLEADSCSAGSEKPVFYGLVVVMLHKTYPIERNTNQLHQFHLLLYIFPPYSHPHRDTLSGPFH